MFCEDSKTVVAWCWWYS